MSPQSISLISTLLLLFGSAIVGGMVAKKLRLPLILGYILGGVFVGNVFSGSVDRSLLERIADTGVTLLLFTLGVEFSFHRLANVLGIISWAVVAQILLTLLLILGLLTGLGVSFYPALFIASAAALSSTAIVVKLLSERSELDTVPGELATGWLVVQDLAVVPIMVILPAIVRISTSGSSDIGAALGILGISFLKTAVFLVAIIALGKRGVAWVLSYAAKFGSREILLLSIVGIVFLAGLGAYMLGLSVALGAFLAGLLIAETSQNHAVFAEIRPLRDLFAVVFFVSLGMGVPGAFLMSQWPMLLGLSAVIMLVKWCCIYGLSRLLGYHRKTAFFVAVALTQVSEFAFIIASEGKLLGVIDEQAFVFLVATTCITIFASAPLIAHIHRLYYFFVTIIGKRIPPLFPVIEEVSQQRENYPITGHIVICGYGRVGKYIGRALTLAQIPFLVVDYDHATVMRLKDRGIPVVYGDPADKDVLDFAQVDLARGVVIAIPDRHTQELIIGHAQTLNRKVHIICRTHHEEDQPYLKALGVHVIIQPEFEAAITIVEKLLGNFGVPGDVIAGKVSRLKIEHGLG